MSPMRALFASVCVGLPVHCVLWVFRHIFRILVFFSAIFNFGTMALINLSMDINAAGVWLVIFCGEGRKEADRVLSVLHEQFIEIKKKHNHRSR